MSTQMLERLDERRSEEQVNDLLVVTRKTQLSDEVVAFRLESIDGGPLPTWEPGAHIVITLPSGARRQYSIVSDPSDRTHYEIAVLRVENGRGGSRELHSNVEVGSSLPFEGPLNAFPLVKAERYLLIAGGIGITPLVSMARAIAAEGVPASAFVATRRRNATPYEDAIAAVCPTEIVVSEEGGRLRLDEVLRTVEPGTAVYCCGPRRMIDEARSWTFELTRRGCSLHVERFDAGTAADPPSSPGTSNTEFQVTFARTGTATTVGPDDSILECARRAGIVVPSSCEEGYCGTCETRVLDGAPDHRDDFLSAEEKSSGETMMICVSRSANGELTLDL